MFGLAAAGPAAADTGVGVSDDHGKYADDGGAEFFERLSHVGFDANRVTVLWHPEKPDVIVEKPFLDRYVPAAAKHGVKIVFQVYPARSTAIGGSALARERFGSFLEKLARTYPDVGEYVVGNEPNQPRFWRPQFTPSRKPASGAQYAALLARSYDALKDVNPFITVVGVAVSSRGNDNPRAVDNISTSPVRFLRDVGRAYRASGRIDPLMDKLAFHPYPNSSLDSLERGMRWPNAGFANVDRIKQAIWDAFDGTGQPTVERGLKLVLGEIGWQVGVVPSATSAYEGRENVATTTEARQARIYRDIVYRAACDASVSDVYFFGLADERDLDRFQAGLVRADGTRRPSYTAVRNAIARTRGRCVGKRVRWRHATRVAGAKVTFGKLAARPERARWWGFKVTATEQATYTAGVYRVGGSRQLAADARLGLRRSLERNAAGAALVRRGRVSAYWKPVVRFPKRRLAPGRYRYAIRVSAAMNPRRVSFFFSKPFRVG